MALAIKIAVVIILLWLAKRPGDQRVMVNGKPMTWRAKFKSKLDSFVVPIFGPTIILSANCLDAWLDASCLCRLMYSMVILAIFTPLTLFVLIKGVVIQAMVIALFVVWVVSVFFVVVVYYPFSPFKVQ
jgi:hypothetical protein